MVCVQRTTTTRVTCFDFWTCTAKSGIWLVDVSSAADRSRSVCFSDNHIERSNPDPANETLAGDLVADCKLQNYSNLRGSAEIIGCVEVQLVLPLGDKLM